MKELVVISGKGGTGKTSLAASLAILSGQCVVADCDVDAADLHLLLAPEIIERNEFRSGHVAVIRQDRCTGCGECLKHCRFDAIIASPSDTEYGEPSHGAQYNCENCSYCRRSCPAQANDAIQAMSEACGILPQHAFRIDPTACEGCGVCIRHCPAQAIEFPERISGEWMVSQTRCGPMVHAKLGIAQSNSGKLVSLVRQNARKIAEQRNIEWIIVDGSPGIGCPVIASITGAGLVLAVTEPTLSGEHDLRRIVQLAKHFKTPLAVCINKWDLNPEIAERIEADCRKESIPFAGRIRYDRAFTQAQIQGRTVVESGDNDTTEDIRRLWSLVQTNLNATNGP